MAFNLKVIDQNSFDSKESFQAELLRVLSSQAVDLIVLAGFMKILAPSIIDSFLNKIINIHPSLLPKYKGLNTHQKVLDNHDKIHGCTVHVVTKDLDAGQILGQLSCQVDAKDNAVTLQQKVHRLEHLLYPKIIQLICNDRLHLTHSVKFDGKHIAKPGLQKQQLFDEVF